MLAGNCVVIAVRHAVEALIESALHGQYTTIHGDTSST